MKCLSLFLSWVVSSPDPQHYVPKPTLGNVPTIMVELASPQSPEYVSVVDEFQKEAASLKEEEDAGGLTMKVPLGDPKREEREQQEGGKEQQRLTRCLSDPGPGGAEEEDEPFLP